MKTVKLATLVLTAATAFTVYAQTPPPAAGTPPPPAGHPPMHPSLTKEQMDCLHKTLGTPSKDNRPSPQKMAEAFKTCNIQMPGKPPAK